MTNNKEEIDALHKLCVLNKLDIYADCLERFSNNLGVVENNPFLGYIGKNYFTKTNKICFIGKAGGESRYLTAIDKLMNDKFIKFKESSKSERTSSFYQYQSVICQHIQTWNVFRIPAFLNSQIDQSVDDIAYLNIVPFRYKGAPTKSVYRIAWSVFTNKIFEILKPDYVIPLGKRLHEEVRSNYSGFGKVTDGITRTNGDTYLHREAIQQITTLAQNIKKQKANK